MSNAKLKVTLTGVLLIFAIIPAIIVGLVGSFSIAGYENNVKSNTLETVSFSKSSAVDELFQSYISDVSAISKLDVVAAAAKNGDDGADHVVNAFTANHTDVLDTLVLDAKGTVISAATSGKGSTFENYDENSMPSVSTVKSWKNYGGTEALFVSREIYADPATKTGGKVGYVVMVISLAPDSGIYKALSGTYLDGANLMLVDSDHNVLNFLGTGDSFVFKNGAYDGAFANEISRMFDNTPNVTDANTIENDYVHKSGKYVYACGIIPNVPNWRWVGVAQSSTFSSFALKTNLIGWGIIVVMCAICALGAVLIISKFTSGMQEMLKTMDAISNEEGGSEIRFNVKSEKSELGEIQTSFNDMLDEIYLSEERHRTIAELSDNMLFEWDFRKERMYVSPNTLAKFDLNPAECTLSNGRFLDSLMDAEGAEKYKRDINMLLKNKNGYSAEYQLRAKSGAVIWVSVRANCVTDRLGEPIRVIGVMTDIDNEKKMELQLSERASFDFLSQLYNRNTFIKEFTSEIERRGQNKICAMFLDVDDFKFINDRFGHTVGDEVIRFVADNIRKKVDDRGGFAGRFGGDEFVLCMTDQEDIENAEDIAMNIIDELNMGYTTSEGTLINVKISIGITYCPEHSENPTELLSFADTAMYFVKKNGKMNYHVYMPEDTESGEYNDPESVF